MADRSSRPRQVAVGSLGVTAACLPLYVVRWHLGPLPTTLLENLILITVAAYALTLWTERRLPAARTFLDIPIGLFLLAGIVGIVVAPDHTRGLGIYRAYFIEAIGIFYVAVDLIRTRTELRRVLAIAAVGGSLFALGQITLFVIALAQHNVHVDSGPAFLNTSANAVAMYLEPPLAFAVGFVLFPSAPRERWLASVALGLILTANILSLSRASYLAMAVLAVMVMLTVPSRRWRLGTVAALGVLALVVLELPFMSQRLGSLAHSVTGRVTLYTEALRMLSQRPILGAGISGFPVRVAPFRPASGVIELYPHNVWLTTWSELGLLGLIAFALIFFSLMWRAWRALGKASGIHRPIIWGAIGALVLYLVHGMFDSPYWKNDLSVEFWLIAAFEVVAIRGVLSNGRGGD